MITDDIIHIVYRDIFNPVLFLSLSPSFSADKFKNGRILTSQIIFGLKPLCLVKRRQGKTVLKWRRANISLISWSEYSSCKCVTLYLDLFYFFFFKNHCFLVYKKWFSCFSLLSELFYQGFYKSVLLLHLWWCETLN